MNDIPDMYDDMMEMYDDMTCMYEYHIHVWYHVPWCGNKGMENRQLMFPSPTAEIIEYYQSHKIKPNFNDHQQYVKKKKLLTNENEAQTEMLLSQVLGCSVMQNSKIFYVQSMDNLRLTQATALRINVKELNWGLAKNPLI